MLNRALNQSRWVVVSGILCAALWAGESGSPPTAAAQAPKSAPAKVQPKPQAPPLQPLAQTQPPAQPEESGPPQTVLAPGLYLFQTRTRDGNCPDATRTGYVTSAVATLDGVPGSRNMTMQLINSKYWPTWNLTVTREDVITGTANRNGGKDASQGSSRFELRSKKERFQGVGARTYSIDVDGKKTDCVLNYDALLKPLD